MHVMKTNHNCTCNVFKADEMCNYKVAHMNFQAPHCGMPNHMPASGSLVSALFIFCPLSIPFCHQTNQTSHDFGKSLNLSALSLSLSLLQNIGIGKENFKSTCVYYNLMVVTFTI